MYTLLQLLKNKVKWNWNDTCKQAFINVKNLFKNDMILRHPNFKKTFTLYTDTSMIGLGAILCQNDDNGKKWAIHMASRTLQEAEKNYFTSELELLAIVWA